MGKTVSGGIKTQEKLNPEIRFYVAIAMAIFWMAFIFYLSAQPASISSSESLSVLKTILRLITPAFQIEEQSIAPYNEISRTIMHGFVFFVLAILVVRAVRMRQNSVLKPLGISASICFAYSLLDETHQLFVPGRSFQIFDILIDTSGILVGIALYMLLIYIKNSGKREKPLKTGE